MKFREIPEYTDVLDLIGSYEEKHPELNSEVKLQALKCELYLRLAYENLLADKLTDAVSWINRFEESIENTSAALIDENLISQVYSEALGLYFVKGNKTAARRMADRGLKYAPKSIELANRKRMLN